MAEPALAKFAEIEPRVSIHWKAFELRPHPVPVLDPNGDYLTGVWQEHVYPLADKMGFIMKLPPVQPRTRLPHAVAKWAADNDQFGAFNTELFRAFFQDGLNIGKLEILMQIAERLDLNQHELESESCIDSYMSKVLLDEKMARDLNVRAVPAYVSNGTILAAGMQSLSQLRQLIDLQ